MLTMLLPSTIMLLPLLVMVLVELLLPGLWSPLLSLWHCYCHWNTSLLSLSLEHYSILSPLTGHCYMGP